jgi:hypothetical protein
MIPDDTFRTALMAIESQLPPYEQTCYSHDLSTAFKSAKVVKVDARDLYGNLWATSIDCFEQTVCSAVFLQKTLDFG